MKVEFQVMNKQLPINSYSFYFASVVKSRKGIVLTLRKKSKPIIQKPTQFLIQFLIQWRLSYQIDIFCNVNFGQHFFS